MLGYTSEGGNKCDYIKYQFEEIVEC